MVRRACAVVVSMVILAGCASTGTPQSSAVAYPAKGQTAQQQQADSDSCVNWAKQQSGYDPAVDTAKGAGVGLLVGAVAGAAAGAAIGAAAGNAGKGAAIGAAVGGVGGAATGGGYQYATSREGYDKAYSVCMQGRGYSVR
jgi:hypothetical protein